MTIVSESVRLNQVSIRVYNSNDFENVLKLERQNFPVNFLDAEELLEYVDNRNVIVATYEETPIAYLGYWVRGDFIELERIAVTPEFRRNGIGSKLVKRIKVKAKTKDAIRCWVREPEYSTHLFLKENGFLAIPVPDRYRRGPDGRRKPAYIALNHFRVLGEDGILFEYSAKASS
jgi:[ribosomal protein S18]-alanine N-acetyltransferase